MGEEPNHTTARKPGPLYTIKYSQGKVVAISKSNIMLQDVPPVLYKSCQMFSVGPFINIK